MTDQPVAWAGVVLRFADDTFVGYEFDHPYVQLQLSSGEMTRDELLHTLLNGNVANEVDVRVSGKSTPWVPGARAARVQQLEEFARGQARKEPT